MPGNQHKHKLEQVNFHRDASKIRRLICKYATQSLAHKFFEYLHTPANSPLRVTERRPWVALLALEWCFELSPNASNKQATAEDAIEILNKIWNIQSLSAPFRPEHSYKVQLRALIIPQLRFQQTHRYHSSFLLRNQLILDYHPAGERLKRKFESVFELPLQEFIEMAFFLMVYFAMDGKTNMRFETVIVLFHPRFSLSKIAKFITLIGSTFKQFKTLTKRNSERQLRPEEYFQDSIFFKKPLLIDDKGIVVAHPSVFIRGISEFFSTQFLRRDEKLRREFSLCFERYIETIISKAKLPFVTERELLAFYKSKRLTNRKVVDFILNDDDSLILLDSKGVEPTPNISSQTRRYWIAQYVKGNHIKGIEQAIETVTALIDGEYENLPKIDKRYALIVTNQDFFVGTGEEFCVYLNDESAATLKDKAKGVVELANIHFLSIEIFESLLALRSRRLCSVPQFLDYVREQAATLETQNFFMEQYMQSFCKNRLNLETVPPGADDLEERAEQLWLHTEELILDNSGYWRKSGCTPRSIEHFIKVYFGLVKEISIRARK